MKGIVDQVLALLHFGFGDLGLKLKDQLTISPQLSAYRR